ncbi:MAG TPA: hypothetical protein VD794_08415, partial [Flavisolibacter sp.]|nr:hypothetical protein [Flavisolibacter sp.]
QLDTFDINTVSKAAQAYQQQFKNTDANTRDSGYILFNQHYETIEKNSNELHVKDTANYNALTPENPTGKAGLPVKQQHYVESLHKNGFQLASAEGMTYIKPDLDVINSWFQPYISPTFKEYLSQLNKENKEGFAVDAGITISPKQYVDRVIWWENFIKNNPSFIRLAEAKEKRKHLLTFLIQGMENTPVRSYLDGSLEEYFKTAYTYLQNAYPNAESNQLVNPYYKALLQKDVARADSLVKEYGSKGYITYIGEQ